MGGRGGTRVVAILLPVLYRAGTKATLIDVGQPTTTKYAHGPDVPSAGAFFYNRVFRFSCFLSKQKAMTWSLLSSRYACYVCGGDGKCKECFGSGVNTHLNSDQPRCPNCGGTGTCPQCGGTGQRGISDGRSLTTLDLEDDNPEEK